MSQLFSVPERERKRVEVKLQLSFFSCSRMSPRERFSFLLQ